MFLHIIKKFKKFSSDPGYGRTFPNFLLHNFVAARQCRRTVNKILCTTI